MRNDGSFSANAVWPAASSSRHPGWLAPGGTGIHGLVAELLLDAHELVVLGVALGTAGRAGLDLTGAQADDKVGNEGVLGLAGAVRGHDAPATLLAELHRIDGLSHGADLVDLQQQRVARAHLQSLLDARWVGDEEVVAHDLDLGANRVHHRLVRVPVVLVEGILDGHQRVLRDPGLVILNQLRRRLLHLWRAVRVLEVQVVELRLRVVEF
mmetsp:Transcript_18383/g.47316  ORF Transcript_18383/g.47316 Transcript_18383/m.47316 type:complete len:211 (+) Transcript_18383:255-887(+)